MKRTAAPLCSIATLFLAVSAGSADPAPRTKPVVVPFELVPSGHFIVKVRLDGNGPYNLIFDTGAPTTLISPRVAKEAKIDKSVKDRPLIAPFGMMGQAKIKNFQVGNVSAENVSAMIIDHPTVKLFSKEYEKKYGSIEGIVGFPFFAQFRMTVDYAAKTLTFTPNGYQAGDVMESLMSSMMGSMGGGPKPPARTASSAAIWGIQIEKSSADEEPGITITHIEPGSAAEQFGLKKGDRLLTIGGRWTDTLSDTHLAASFAKPGKPVKVTVLRGGREVPVTVTPRLGF